MATRADMLTDIEELCFACLDMNLYLDNNKDDERALATYNKLCSEFAKARMNYEKRYGPLNNFGYSPSQSPFQWVEGPWPWENKFYEM
ncbi:MULTISPECIES: spore coat protein CotJB [Paraclostridium]|uniref:spore coat protein CotJB n=1 Tax=Paraclostridium TaxID=1849822 RepID=UPI00051CFCA7|nr:MULTISPECIES: spore coat protein CotJB [Paraclostridium]KGJ50791.1 polypeptide composition of the spore coat protein CotJB [Clostridium sp. NCR]MBZ6006614.1 spore coat protein CotJB [Paraclostridium bifermentans]MCU9810601.1 spore coat protein CotJB [Paraclostridium sp. AKS81]MDU0296336.1 spore coat protein CotJB [Paraclostridium sp. MRS3W1]MDU3337484.1 spore coat protein CotJB [Paraclostridium bifermentans]